MLCLTHQCRDLKWDNVHFEEKNGKLHKANFMDWGITQDAPEPQGENGEYTKEQEEKIVRPPVL